MPKPVNHISLKSTFFVWLGDSLITIGYNGLPSDVHFTLSFHPDSNDANIHVTRERHDHTDKPQIKIVVFDKKLMEEALEKMWKRIFYLFYETIPFKRRLLPKIGYRQITKYMSFDELESHDDFHFRKGLEQIFLNSSKHSESGRVKIKPDITQQFEKWVKSKRQKDTVRDLLRPLPRELSPAIETGFLSTAYFSGPVIRAGRQFYRQRTDVNLVELLDVVLGREVASTIIEKARAAIEQVSAAETFAETERLGKPVRLF